MKIKSLSRQMDLMFSRFSGEVVDRGDYIAIKTPSIPNYYWGNYLMFNHAPEKGSLKKWKDIFKEEFDYYSEIKHMVFAWEDEKNIKGDYQEFIDEGFKLDEGIALTTDQLIRPLKYNSQIVVRKVETEIEWKEALELEVMTRREGLEEEKYRNFKIQKMDQYRQMIDQNKGVWFGAFQDNCLVAELGIFYENAIGTYQDVVTHPQYRNRGICKTLLYESFQYISKQINLQKMVIETDIDNHAAKIYQSLGFKKSEINYALTWWID